MAYHTPALLVVEKNGEEATEDNNFQVRLSLLTKCGNVGHGYGINWGHNRDGAKRNPNSSYIAIPPEINKKYPDFFPNRRVQFIMLTEDEKSINCLVSKSGSKAAIHSVNDGELGLYIREKLGLVDGAFVNKFDLVRYGRSDVTITKIDDKNYRIDFSIKNKNE